MIGRRLNPRTRKQARREAEAVYDSFKSEFTGEPRTKLGSIVDTLTLGLSRKIRAGQESRHSRRFLNKIFVGATTLETHRFGSPEE